LHQSLSVSLNQNEKYQPVQVVLAQHQFLDVSTTSSRDDLMAYKVDASILLAYITYRAYPVNSKLLVVIYEKSKTRKLRIP
jgi:hypothetical protein